MNFKEYIRDVGVAEVARTLGVSKRAVYAYLSGTRHPSAATIQRIVNRTPVSYAGIFGEHRETVYACECIIKQQSLHHGARSCSPR